MKPGNCGKYWHGGPVCRLCILSYIIHNNAVYPDVQYKYSSTHAHPLLLFIPLPCLEDKFCCVFLSEVAIRRWVDCSLKRINIGLCNMTIKDCEKFKFIYDLPVQQNEELDYSAIYSSSMLIHGKISFFHSKITLFASLFNSIPWDTQIQKS